MATYSSRLTIAAVLMAFASRFYYRYSVKPEAIMMPQQIITVMTGASLCRILVLSLEANAEKVVARGHLKPPDDQQEAFVF